ncbi:TPA: type III secretion system chaperone IpgA, partial [Shigella flexneri]
CLLPDTHQCVLTKKHYKKYLSPDELIESLYEFLFCIKLTIANITSEVN